MAAIFYQREDWVKLMPISLRVLVPFTGDTTLVLPVIIAFPRDPPMICPFILLALGISRNICPHLRSGKQ
jgi:hypothetical protein